MKTATLGSKYLTMRRMQLSVEDHMADLRTLKQERSHAYWALLEASKSIEGIIADMTVERQMAERDGAGEKAKATPRRAMMTFVDYLDSSPRRRAHFDGTVHEYDNLEDALYERKRRDYAPFPVEEVSAEIERVWKEKPNE